MEVEGTPRMDGVHLLEKAPVAGGFSDCCVWCVCVCMCVCVCVCVCVWVCEVSVRCEGQLTP